jgi:hypothetical protein
MAGPRRLDRFIEPAIWILVALERGARTIVGLFDGARSLDGPIGHGTLLAALARLERLRLVELARAGDGWHAYRLTDLGTAARSAASALGEGGYREVTRA